MSKTINVSLSEDDIEDLIDVLAGKSLPKLREKRLRDIKRRLGYALELLRQEDLFDDEADAFGPYPHDE